jgi:hypothetical protein
MAISGGSFVAASSLPEAVHVLCCLFVVVWVGCAHLELGQNANAHSRARTSNPKPRIHTTFESPRLP